MHDLLVQWREFWSPAQHLTRFAGVADKNWGIARPPSADLDFHRLPGDFLTRFHDLGDRKTAAIAEIEESLGLPVASHSMAATCASAKSLTCT